MIDTNTPMTHSKALSTYDFSGSKYSSQERIAAAVAYMVHGTLSKTSEACGIPLSTVHGWKHSEWWEHLLEEVRNEKEDEWDAGHGRIIGAAQEQVEDALKHGEIKLVKTKDGYKEKRVPVGAKDAAVIGGIALDKLRVSRNLPTSISVNAGPGGILAKLEELSDRLDQREASVVDEQ